MFSWFDSLAKLKLSLNIPAAETTHFTSHILSFDPLLLKL